MTITAYELQVVETQRHSRVVDIGRSKVLDVMDYFTLGVLATLKAPLAKAVDATDISLACVLPRFRVVKRPGKFACQ